MINYLKKAWNNISHLGIDTDDSYLNVRYNILANQINILLFLSMLVMNVFMYFYRNIYDVAFNVGDIRINVIMFATLGNLILAYFKKLKALKISLIFVIPFLLLIAPTLVGFVEEESFFYYPIITIVLSVLLQLLLDYKEDKVLYIGSIIYFLIFIFYLDKLLLYFAPDGLEEITTIYRNNIIITKAVYLIVFLFLHFAVFYLKSINRKYEKKLIRVNERLKEQNRQLDTKNEELTAMNENLKNTQQQLVYSEKMASLGVLTAGIAHEINNPLNFISGGSFIVNDFMVDLQNGKPVDGDSIEYALKGCEMITKGIDQASSVVSSLMTFSYSGKPKKQYADINEIIDSTLMFQKQRIPVWLKVEKNFKFSKPVNIYSEKMHQVILNLIDNALFEIKRSDLPENEKFLRIETGFIEEYNSVFISIANSGRNIDEETGSRIFDPFFTTKEPGQGTGLGLSIVHNLIKEHKGRIRFNNLNNGVEFVITIPFDTIGRERVND